MADISLSANEWYPVWEPSEQGHLFTELPDEVVQPYLAAYAEFATAMTDLAGAINDHREREARRAHYAEIQRRRQERGQRRPRRRAHPDRGRQTI